MADQNKIIFEKLTNILDTVAERENIKNYKSLPDINENKGEGFLSEFFTGKVLNQDSGKSLEVAIKLAPARLDFNSLYQNEMYFYTEAFPRLDKFQRENGVKQPFNNIPRYLAGSVETKKEFIAMENLKSENYELIDKTKYFDSEHLELIFKTYGKFHALSFTFKQQNLEAYKNLVEGFNDTMGLLVDSPAMQQQIIEDYEDTLKIFDPINDVNILEKLNKIKDIKKTISDARNYSGNNRCLIHGDCWSNNMLFRKKESGTVEDIKLLDFQLTYENTPIHDLSYFFYTGASKTDMDKLDYYLNIYYSSLCGFVKELHGDINKIFSLEEFTSEWRQYSHLGLLLGIHVWVTKLMNKDEIMEVLSKSDLPKEKYGEVWLTAKSKTRETEAFKERARNICIHAVEYGIL